MINQKYTKIFKKEKCKKKIQMEKRKEGGGKKLQ
jgi:hypothetical protein